MVYLPAVAPARATIAMQDLHGVWLVAFTTRKMNFSWWPPISLRDQIKPASYNILFPWRW
jgi:hypothetical protein